MMCATPHAGYTSVTVALHSIVRITHASRVDVSSYDKFALFQKSRHDIVLVDKASPSTTSDTKCSPRKDFTCRERDRFQLGRALI